MTRTTQKAALDSIAGFSKAGVAMGNIHVKRESEIFEQTGHSCYSEGWAAGYLAAMKTVAQFVEDTLKETSRG